MKSPGFSRPRLLPVLLALATTLSSSPAPAMDQPILGRRLVVRDPAAHDPSRRSVGVTARSAGSATLPGDPTSPGAGALVTISLAGNLAQEESFFLAQGIATNGQPFWKATSPAGFRYTDARGQQGPVRSLVLKRPPSGKVKLTVKLRAKKYPLGLTPPDPGTDAMVTVEVSGGDRYCARFGAEGVVRNADARLFGVAKPTAIGCPDEGARGEILALSYNVAGLPQGLSGSDPEVNTPIIGPRLNGYDLVLLQETWLTPSPNPLAPLRTYHEILEAASEHPFQSVSLPAPLGSDPTRPSALLADGLNRFSRFPFQPVNRVRWSDCHASSADCLAQKGFSYTRTTLAPGVEVDVYNLHMEAGGDPEDEAIRDAGVTQLVEAMTTFSAGRAIIVGGDFNLHLEDEPDATQYERLLDQAGLTDVCAALACANPNRIDKFAFRSDADVSLTPVSWNFENNVFKRDDGEPLSDHDALAVRFQWERSGSGSP